ncbi:MAG: T9SS type B sorting domain-containing protein, partial [Bacteroidota bacterium]
NYSVQIRSSKNCIQTLPDIIISEPSQLLLSTPTISDFTCTLENNPGTASITASILDLGGTPTGTGPYNYSFNGGSFTTNDTFELPFTNVDQTVTIDVIDANNCTDQTTINVPASEKVLATIVETQQMNCEDDAIIEVVGNNGSGIANYVVRELPSGNLINATGQGIITIPAGNPGNYIYELTDTDTGCTSRVNYEIANFNIIEINAVTKINDISCVGADNGAFSFEVIGFTTGFNYEIFNITDTTVPFRSEPSIRTGTTAVPVENLPPGTYYAVIRDETSKCAVTSENITIQSPVFPLDFTDQLTKPLSCNPGNDAEITVTPIGGWGGYLLKLEDATNNIVIQDFDSNTVFGALQSGLDYRVTLKDARGCEDVIKILTPVAPIDPITVGAPTVVQPSCFGIPDASIEVTATGGQGPTYYQYVLRNLDSGIESAPQSTNSFLGLPKGEYEVVVTDNLGCVGVTTPSVRIDYPDEIEIDAIISHEPTCMTDGGITVSATGGSGNFEYQYVPIDENQNRGTPSGWSDDIVYTLGSGTYEFTARDKTFLCVSPIPVIRTIQKVESFEIIVDTSNTTINCHNESDAVLVAQASGGLGGYQYQILKDGTPQGPPQDSGIFENLGKGDYIIVATSGTDCSVSSEDTQGIISIVEPDELIASFSKKTDIQCFGETTGSISIDVQGGVPPYQYIISSEPQKASENHLFQDLEMGSYTVIVQDANGCDKEVAFTIEGPVAPLNVELTAFKDEVCSSDDNGSMTLAFSGGTPPYRYSMESPDGPFTNVTNPGSLLLPDLDGGTTYFVFVKDANECEQFIQHEVKIGVDLTATYETLYECVDGRAISRTTINLNDSEIANKVLYILDAADPNNPEITDEATDNGLFEDLEDGEHIVSIVHEGGCVEVLSGILIRNPQPLTLELKPGNINQILVEAAGGDGNYTYYFDGIPHNNGSYYIVRDGTYTISVEDGKGCVEAIQVEMQFIDIEIPDFFTPNGDGKNDVWAIKNSEGFPDIYVSIFDRYGRQIKEFIREGEWNGTYNDSQLPTGDYWYIIKLNGPDDPREFVGHVTVYR